MFRTRALFRLGLVWIAALLCVPAPAADDPLLLTLLQVKTAYREKRWSDAQLALRTLLELASAPEREAVRPKVLPAYHFYSAAVAWEMKDQERAKEEVELFLDDAPDATLDPSLYPKSFRIFFEAEQNRHARESVEAPAGPQSIAGGVVPDYGTFAPDESAIPLNDGRPDWVASPVRLLLTERDKRSYRSLPDDEARRDFVARFWQRLDPTPETPQNEFEQEFYRRVQFADANFSTESVRGSLSDRGMVLILLGPPSYIGRRSLLKSQDPIINRRESGRVVMANPGGRPTLMVVPGEENAGTPGDIEGQVESWYYRKGRVPKGIPFTDLQFEFITKRGYGTAILQRDSRELLALDRATALARKPR